MVKLMSMFETFMDQSSVNLNKLINFKGSESCDKLESEHEPRDRHIIFNLP